ncbi:LmeA family phospholipid-binding protein [Nocardia concava]|uniref:LmeA family phospholipid-binding protein n=1 Tax=Nocardia concava TaxID=257281 RepID=UPI0002FA2FF4|nr:DUF2993 domain-containing protein [Nocardia concava]
MRALLILIVVLGIALVVGDRVAVVTAQNEIAREIAAQYKLPHQPRVEIRGFPFLTQAIDGTYDDVRINVGDWSEQNITVHDLDVTLNDVTAKLDDLLNKRTTNLVAGTATATAVVPYDVVQKYAPEGIESISDSPEGLRATGTFSVQGLQVPATVIVTVAPTDSGIEITPVSVEPASSGVSIPLALLGPSLTFTVPLQQLPLGAKLTAITPRSDGLHVSAVAHTVRFSDLP